MSAQPAVPADDWAADAADEATQQRIDSAMVSGQAAEDARAKAEEIRNGGQS